MTITPLPARLRRGAKGDQPAADEAAPDAATGEPDVAPAPAVAVPSPLRSPTYAGQRYSGPTYAGSVYTGSATPGVGMPRPYIRPRPAPRTGPAAVLDRMPFRRLPPGVPKPPRPLITSFWWRRVAKAGVAVVFACSFALSFAALHQLALDAGIDASLAWMFPVCIDTLAIVASATAVAVQNGERRATWTPWAVVLVFLAVSIAGNAQHAYASHHITVSTHIAVAVSAVPPIALGLALHLLLLMARNRARIAQAAAEKAAAAGSDVAVPRP